MKLAIVVPRQGRDWQRNLKCEGFVYILESEVMPVNRSCDRKLLLNGLLKKFLTDGKEGCQFCDLRFRSEEDEVDGFYLFDLHSCSVLMQINDTQVTALC